MGSTHLFLVVAVAGSAIGQGKQAVDPAVAAARARQDLAKTVVLEFKQTDIEPAGSRSGQLPAPYKTKLSKIVPEKETTTESKNRLVLDGPKMRFENNHPIWNMADGKLWPSPRVEVDDGETGKIFFPLGITSEEKPKGRVHASADRWDFKLALLNPIYFAFRGNDPEVCPYPMSAFRPTGASVPIGRASCSEYLVNRGDMVIAAWCDPAADYAVRRLTETNKGKLRRQIDVEQRRDDKWGWVPAAWTVTEYNIAGDLSITERVEVTTLRIGEPQPASEFQLRFPPGTFLIDYRKDKNYRIQPNESMVEISPRGEPVGFGRELPQPGESFFSQHKWLLISAVIVFLSVVVLFFARRRLGKPKPR